jgi:hypothetical protein
VRFDDDSAKVDVDDLRWVLFDMLTSESTDSIFAILSDSDDYLSIVRIEASITTTPLLCCNTRELYYLDNDRFKNKVLSAIHVENRDSLIILSHKTDNQMYLARVNLLSPHVY